MNNNNQNSKLIQINSTKETISNNVTIEKINPIYHASLSTSFQSSVDLNEKIIQ
jgi:hypothetical protein